MYTHRLSTFLCCILLPLLPQSSVSEEEEEGGGIGLTESLLPGDRELLGKADDLVASSLDFTYDPRPRTYMGVDEEAAKEDLERNCVAWLYKIAGERLIMVFPSPMGRVEIYELKR